GGPGWEGGGKAARGVVGGRPGPGGGARGDPRAGRRGGGGAKHRAGRDGADEEDQPAESDRHAGHDFQEEPAPGPGPRGVRGVSEVEVGADERDQRAPYAEQDQQDPAAGAAGARDSQNRCHEESLPEHTSADIPLATTRGQSSYARTRAGFRPAAR